MAENRPQCDEMVSNGFGVGMHQCHRKAILGSVYCAQHHKMHSPAKFTPRQHQAKPEIKRTSVSIDSRLEWLLDDAPTVKGAYAAKPTFVTSLKFKAYSNADPITIEASGPVRKADGSAGLAWQTVRINDIDRQFAESTAQVILDEINRLRDLLKQVSPDA